MSYSELIEWAEYYSIEPFGEWRADVRAALLASVQANMNRDEKKRPEPYGINDFMLFEKRKEAIEMTDEDDGAHIDPSTIAWLFGQVNQSVH